MLRLRTYTFYRTSAEMHVPVLKGCGAWDFVVLRQSYTLHAMYSSRALTYCAVVLLYTERVQPFS